MMQDDYYQIELPIEAVRLIHKSLDFHYKKWAGGEPQEQEDLHMMRDNFYRIILEHQFENMW